MKLLLYIVVGFIAQMIDGTIGMAYGVTCRTFLSTFVKIPSNVISSVVHYAEIPTSFSSMIAHIKYKNINKKMFIQLISTGIFGSIIGAYLITLNFGWIELVVDAYLVVIGFLILSKAIMKKNKKRIIKKNIYIYLLGFIGSFFDASGGGGYGPIVTGTLISKSDDPKKVIGTVNSSEFFVTLTSSITFVLLIANIKQYLLIIVGLIIGGVLAAPFAAKLCLKIKEKNIFILTGTMLIILNIYNIINFIK